MSSLHARRPPRLEQGEHLRKTKRSTGIIPKRGAGSLRRPPTASSSGTGIQTGKSGGEKGNIHSSSKKKCCNLQRTIVCTFVAVVLMFLFMQIRSMFGLMLSNSDASHLRGISTSKSKVDPAVNTP
mmetsp:Transcript_6535/g.10606  ORF Transcript_6535/g.10606 Transcript_6535/m.10606 type:complete len:126 (+) Transcript_6535:222-599(+)